ncbi:LxmA leader domain family RiPP [Micromonospora sp. CPCC 206060]
MADEKLMDGYQAYTDAEELNFAEVGDAELPTTTVFLTVTTVGATFVMGC